MNNREKLIDIMFDHSLDRRDLADLVSVDRRTVDGWLASSESTRHLDIPDMAIELLNLKLGAMHGAEDPAPVDAPNEN